MKIKSPVCYTHMPEQRTLVLPRPLADLDKEIDWMLNWVKVHMEYKLHLSDLKPFVVYIAAVLGKDFNKGVDIRSFIQDHPEQVWLYFGRDASGSLDIHRHHEDNPESSPLGTAASQGLTVVCLHREEFTGEWAEKTKRMCTYEACLIVSVYFFKGNIFHC